MLGKFQEDELPSNYDLALGFLQVFDIILNISQVSNDVLFKELQRQDKEYLEKIIKQNEEIIKLLKNKEG